MRNSEVFAAYLGPEPLGLKQIAQYTGLHPSTAHRILAVMVESRLVDRIEPGTYRLEVRAPGGPQLGASMQEKIRRARRDGPAIARAVVELGKPVVTANTQLVARRGAEAHGARGSRTCVVSASGGGAPRSCA